LTAALTALVAPAAAGAPRSAAVRAWWRDGHRHPSPNAGRCEAAAAGALGVRLGGRNVYGGRVEERPALGDGRAPEVRDIGRVVGLSAAIETAAVVVAAGVALAVGAAGRRARRVVR
jgi:adenosylcobinamide-phosphate synthase